MDTFPDMSEYDVALIGAAVTERLESPEGIAALSEDETIREGVLNRVSRSTYRRGGSMTDTNDARARLLAKMEHERDRCDAYTYVTDSPRYNECDCVARENMDLLLSDSCRADLAEASGLYTADDIANAQASEGEYMARVWYESGLREGKADR